MSEFDYKSYRCWIDEDWERDDAVKVETFLDAKGAAEKFVHEDLYECGYFSEGVNEDKPIRICVETSDGVVTKWGVYISYSVSFSAERIEESSDGDREKQEPSPSC